MAKSKIEQAQLRLQQEQRSYQSMIPTGQLARLLKSGNASQNQV